MQLGFTHAQRVKIGDQVAANTVSADDHQRADAVQNGRADLRLVQCDTLFSGFFFDLFACGLWLCWPLTIKGGGQIICGRWRPIGARPTWACCLCFGVCRGVTQRPEERLPRLVHRAGIIGVAGIKLLYVFRVMPLQERRSMECVVRGLVVHEGTSMHCRC